MLNQQARANQEEKDQLVRTSRDMQRDHNARVAHLEEEIRHLSATNERKERELAATLQEKDTLKAQLEVCSISPFLFYVGFRT